MGQMFQESRWKLLAVGFILVLSCLFAGAMLGLLWVKLFVPAKEMGWDGLADTLGGLMLGALIGVIAGTVMAWKFPLDVQLKGVAVALVIFCAIFLGLALTSSDKEDALLPAPQQEFQQLSFIRAYAKSSQRAAGYPYSC